MNGAFLYRFGRFVNPNNTTTRWNGIGISAAVGTAVRSVSAGTVAYSGPMGTYGNTVILEHGGGDYSVYGSLDRIDVRKGARGCAGRLRACARQPAKRLGVRLRARSATPLIASERASE